MPIPSFSNLRAAFERSAIFNTPQSSASKTYESAPVDLRGLTADVAMLRKAGDLALHKRLQAWLSSLERRWGQVDLRPADRRALAAEFKVLDLETRLAKKQSASIFRSRQRTERTAPGRSDVDNQHLLKARQAFGEALLDQLDDGARALQSIAEHLGRIFQNDPAASDAAMNALHALRDASDDRHRRLASQVCGGMARLAQRAQARAGASSAPRDAPRMPNDCLMHLSCIVDDALALHPGDEALRELSQAAQNAFLAHGGPSLALEILVPRASARLRQLQEPEAAARCLRLLEQLPAMNDSGKARLNQLQLHDNPYGRAFDSLFAADLVDTPPPGMLSAVDSLSQAFAGQLQDTPVTRMAAEGFRDAMRENPRAWQALVPGYQGFLAAPEGKALDVLASFLGSPSRDGPDAMARLYLVTYLGQYQRSAAQMLGRPEEVPRHLEKSAGTYGPILAQRSHEDPAIKQRMAPTRGTGILLRHQPAATDDARLTPSHRTASLHRIGELRADAGGLSTGSVDYSKAADRQLRQGVVYGSGASGSTNMLLHLYAELRVKGLTSAPARDVLLACATLMCHDGGHSMHEALWAGNLLDPELKFGLGLSDEAARPQAFVLDHKAFIDGFDGPTRDALRQATDRAWSGTQDYLRTHSHFARAERAGGGA